jgi:hypothetical protein
MKRFFKGKSKMKSGKAVESGLLQATGLAMSVGRGSPSPSSQNVTSSPSPTASPTSQSAPTTAMVSGTPASRPSSGRMHEVGSAAYAGFTAIVQGLYDCSDMFLPLKTAAGIFLTISGVVEVRGIQFECTLRIILSAQRVSANREELEELEAKLDSIRSTVQKYKAHGGISALHSRIERFCERVGSLFLPMSLTFTCFSETLYVKWERSKTCKIIRSGCGPQRERQMRTR